MYPKTETTTIGSDGSGVTCTPSETTFKASNALIAGKWENTWFYGQMDKTIAILQKLQDAGITAIWRPFHEGAGNLYAKTYTGTAWFWWGEDGPDTYKALWKAMFAYFQEKGIHNLIWEWTAQNYNGDSNSYDNDNAFYPGDKYVDLVGRDLYGNTAAQNKTEFTQLTSQYSNKMTLHYRNVEFPKLRLSQIFLMYGTEEQSGCISCLGMERTCLLTIGGKML
jgi:beta-mannanase